MLYQSIQIVDVFEGAKIQEEQCLFVRLVHSRTRGSSENLEIQKMLLFFICCCFLNLRWNLWGSWDFQRFWTILPQAEESGLAVIITVGK